MNCRSVWEKYKVDLITGASDPDTVLPGILAELKNGGFNTVLEEARRQVGEFSK